MRKRITFASYALLLAAVVSPAYAHTPLAFVHDEGAGEHVDYLYWQQVLDGVPIPFSISSLGTPDINLAPGDPAIDEFEAMQLAFDAWEAVSGVAIQFDVQSTTTNQAGFDGENVIYFADEGDVGYGGVALITYDNVTGQILDADIHMNDHNILWQTSPNDGDGEPLPCPCEGTDPNAVFTNDIQGLATHEIGHILGLDHSAVGVQNVNTSPTMYPRGIWGAPGDEQLPPNSRYRTVERDDVIGLQTLYPPPTWESDTATVSGIVHDDYDQPLFGAHIVARDLLSGEEVGVMSGVVAGPYTPETYENRGLPAAEYELRAEAINGSPPGLVGPWNFGGIAQNVVSTKFPAEVELSTQFHRLVYAGDNATPVIVGAGESETVSFRPVAQMDKLPSFLRNSAPFTIDGAVNPAVTGPLTQANLHYTLNGGRPVIEPLPLDGAPFSIPIAALPAGTLLEFNVVVETTGAELFQTLPRKMQVGLSGAPLVFVSKQGSFEMSAVDTGTFFEIDSTSEGLSFPNGQVYHAAKHGLYVASFGIDKMSFIPFGRGILPDPNPRAFDIDGDDLIDALEPIFGTNPTDPDTDGDLSFDGKEISRREFTHPDANPSFFEVVGGTVADDGVTPLGGTGLNIAIWNVTESAWATGAMTTTPSGRYKLRLQADTTFRVSYFYQQQSVGSSVNFTASHGETISAGVTQIAVTAPKSLQPDSGSDPLDSLDGSQALFLEGAQELELASGVDPWGVVLSHGCQESLYFTGFGSNTLYKLDTATDSIINQVAVGNNPQGVALSPDGATIYVANVTDDTVSVIDEASMTVVDTINLPGSPRYIKTASASPTAVVVMSGTQDVAFIDTTTHTLTQTIASGLGGLYFLSDPAPDSNIMIAGDFQVGDHQLAVIDAELQSATTVDLGSEINTTSGLALAPDGQSGYAIHYLDPELLEFDVNNGTIIQRLPLGFIDIRDLQTVDGIACETGVCVGGNEGVSCNTCGNHCECEGGVCFAQGQQPIPAVGEWGVLVLLLFTTAMATLVFRRFSKAEVESESR